MFQPAGVMQINPSPKGISWEITDAQACKGIDDGWRPGRVLPFQGSTQQATGCARAMSPFLITESQTRQYWY
jgi:hypothetical protein